jgi:cation:H+ antiporter
VRTGWSGRAIGESAYSKKAHGDGAHVFFSAGAILSNAEPFSEALVATGKAFGINEFLLVQWLAPVASEAPEFTVAIMFALRGQAGTALGSLLSAKVNQWTLLVGMIPGVYGLSRGSLETPIPMGSFQMNEILLTAAQTLLAVILIVGLRLDIKGAIVLFVLFVGQLLSPSLLGTLSGILPGKATPEGIHFVFSTVYLLVSVFFLVHRRGAVVDFWAGVRGQKQGEKERSAIAVVIRKRSIQPLDPEPALEKAASRSTYK